jgi:hypothetical protein
MWACEHGDICGAIQCPDASCFDFDAAKEAEVTCKDKSACSECSDFNFGDDCNSNKKEHCAEIDCCTACEAEINRMWGCEHGGFCGELTCTSATSPISFLRDWSQVFIILLVLAVGLGVPCFAMRRQREFAAFKDSDAQADELPEQKGKQEDTAAVGAQRC